MIIHTTRTYQNHSDEHQDLLSHTLNIIQIFNLKSSLFKPNTELKLTSKTKPLKQLNHCLLRKIGVRLCIYNNIYILFSFFENLPPKFFYKIKKVNYVYKFD